MPSYDRARELGETSEQRAPRRHRPLGRRLAATFSAQQRIAEQIEVAHEFASGVMLEQASLVRQTVARSWALRARVLRMSLDATRYMSRAAVEQTRAEVAAAADRLVAEIIASMESWARTDQDPRALRRDLAALASPTAAPAAHRTMPRPAQPTTAHPTTAHPTPGPRRVTAEDVLVR